MPLNSEQTTALNAVKHGRSIFLTGPGGTGKSHTIHAIVSWAIDTGLRVAVTALTGCAALLLSTGLRGAKARTIHSWAGIGLGKDTPQELADKVKRNRRAARKWLDTQLLIIDEISMMTPDLLEKLDHIARFIRKRPDVPFGGIQVVLAGDFCQLPPVQKGTDAAFAFEAPIWNTLVQETHLLTQIQRQTDPVFQRLLNEARLGALTPESIKRLEDRMGLPWQDNEIRPTLLFSRNTEVNTINRKNLDALPADSHVYDAQTITEAKMGVFPVSAEDPSVAAALERLDTDAPYEARLEIKVGAQVMLLVNKDQERGLVNGSRGVVTGYSLGGLPIVKFQGLDEPVIIDREMWWLSDYDGIGRSQIPLRVAYACTIHKSQGTSLDSALIDIGSATFEFGQAYVALSRVRSLTGLYIWKLDPRKVRCHPRVIAFYEKLTGPGPVSPPPQPPVSPTTSEDPIAEVEEEAEAEPEPTVETKPSPWSLEGLSPFWSDFLTSYMGTTAGQRLHSVVSARASVAPNPDDVFAALRLCPAPAAVRVILLGQDPYHSITETGPIANGLAFSVNASIRKLPPSLANIYKELASDVGPLPPGTSGDLSVWAKQGVLLLNDVLTVSIGAPLSHQGIGWEQLTQQILLKILTTAPHVVIVAWGRNAQKKLEAAPITAILDRHTVLKAPHPSPLSAHTGFFGSKPFSQANAALQTHGQPPIVWT